MERYYYLPRFLPFLSSSYFQLSFLHDHNHLLRTMYSTRNIQDSSNQRSDRPLRGILHQYNTQSRVKANTNNLNLQCNLLSDDNGYLSSTCSVQTFISIYSNDRQQEQAGRQAEMKEQQERKTTKTEERATGKFIWVLSKRKSLHMLLFSLLSPPLPFSGGYLALFGGVQT